MPASTKGQSSFSIKSSTFLSDNKIGKRLYFRIKTCNDLVSENVIFYDLRLSSPHISSVNATAVACFEDENGSIKVNFDRALVTGELLSISMANITTGIDYSEENITALAADNSYTITNLPPGNYTVRVIGVALGYNGSLFNTYSDGATHSSSFTINEPTPVEFSYTKVDVWCTSGSDGEIAITAQGGQNFEVYKYLLREVGDTSENWVAFSSTATFPNIEVTEVITGLAPASYELKVRDSNGCVARVIQRDSGGQIIGLGTEITETVEITEPDNPVAVAFVFSVEPTAYGFSDGRIRAQITGGTPLADGRYNYIWTHANGTTWTTFTDVIDPADGWFLTLENAIVGTYKLTVTDANHTAATDKAGCTIVEAEFTLNEPPLLELSLAETNPISCNSTNTFGDPWSDGQLTVTATGGVPFNPLIDGQHVYMYTWKKKDASGVYQIITGENSNILSNIDAGDYAVNIEDANGIIIGVYENNVLVNATDVFFDFIEPELLEVSLTATEISYGSGNDGTATVNIIGGIAPYSIHWSNGQSTTTATGLIANNYVVYVTDARGCQVSGNITIDQPRGLNIEITEQTNPTCFQGNDGFIALNITGGITPYTYSWNTGATTTSIDNLPEGTYVFQLIDINGYTSFKEVVLEHPDEITIDLGEDKTLCNAQTLDLDGSISDANATYVWTSDNGFTANTAQVTVSEAGTYQVTATSSLGCTATDTIIIYTSDTTIDSEFLMSSQAYVDQDVVLINVSDPLGETTQWVIPADVTIIDETQTTITLYFPKVGTYEVGLLSTQGACYQEIYKNIVVEQSSGLPSAGDTETPFIKEFTITPNPNNGEFEVHIELAEPSPIAIRLFNYLGSFIFSQPTLPTSDDYTIPMNIALSSGIYLVVLETAQETQIKRLIRN